MSIKVELHDLEAAIAGYDAEAYVITTGPSGRPHLSHQRVAFSAGQLRCKAGRSTLANAAAREHIVVLWTPLEPGQMSLIVDGTVGVASTEGEMTIAPTAAVLHRRP